MDGNGMQQWLIRHLKEKIVTLTENYWLAVEDPLEVGEADEWARSREVVIMAVRYLEMIEELRASGMLAEVHQLIGNLRRAKIETMKAHVANHQK